MQINGYIDEQSKADFAAFLGIKMMRTAIARERMDTLLIELFRQGVSKTLRQRGVEGFMKNYKRKTGKDLSDDPEKVASLAAAIADGTYALKQSSQSWRTRQMFERGLEIGLQIQSMRWEVLSGPAGVPFIMSDNPLVLNEPSKGDHPHGFKITAEMQMFFPLSPERFLYGDFKKTQHESGSVVAHVVQRMNHRQMEQAHEHVFASFRSEELRAELEEVFKSRPPLVPELPKDLLSD